QSVSLYDNTADPVTEGQHIMFDAMRLTPCEGAACDDAKPDTSGDGGDDDGTGEETQGGMVGGCAASGSGGGSLGLLLALGALLVVRRRCTMRA
ncbi:MAG TPA: MYXO-CTERM sorting domain-containing protein, partial [Kofleriaceae bacterium]|nr:MYXO-CTERM sorting domain-containing protein [Kofleriaceae bacterium]